MRKKSLLMNKEKVYMRVRRALLMNLWAMTTLLIAPGFVQAQPVTVTITEVTDFDLDIDGGLSPGDFYAGVSINNGARLDTFAQRFSFPFDPTVGYILPWGPLVPNPPWVLTQDVPSELGTVPVRIEIWDNDECSTPFCSDCGILCNADDRADINPDPAKEVIDLVVDLTTGKWTGDVNWPQSCSASSHVKVCFDISVISATGDADGDGLLDSWEQNGFNPDGDGTIDIDLSTFGANPFRKDVFVEVDYLVAVDHIHAPRQDSIADVVQAYANAPVTNVDGTTGVQLHVDVGSLYGSAPGAFISVPGTGGVTGNYGNFYGGGNQIPEAGNEIIESFADPKGNGTPFSSLKAAYFDKSKSPIFHYAIFGHQTNSRQATNDCTSGEASGIRGHDFMVTLGGVSNGYHGIRCSDGTFSCKPDTYQLQCWCLDAGGNSVGNRHQQAGTFMHELGHTLGLQHGGYESYTTDFPKANYLSVMSYAFQMCCVQPSPNGFLPGGCDYSRIELLDHNVPLDESKLDECVGIGGGLGLGPVNWDGDVPLVLQGKTCPEPNTANVMADTNGDGLKTTLGGYEDWNNLNYKDAISGAGGTGGIPKEGDPESIERARQLMANTMAPTVVVDKTGPATAKPGDVLTYSVDIKNQGRGPALSAVLTDTAPDGSAQTSNLGTLVVASHVTQTTTFTVPAAACPGTFTGASASVAFNDFVGNALSASGSVALQILDVSAPTLSVSVSPSILFPSPNHKLELVTTTITVSDNCDPNPTVILVSVTSNEPEYGYIGVGDQGPDIVGADIGTDDRSFFLRAERATFPNSTGRIYTIVYSATDASGNVSKATAIVTVPRDISGEQP